MFGFPMSTMTEKGAYIIMRPFTPDEIAQIAKLISSYHVARTLKLGSAQTAQQEMEWFEGISASTDSVHWAICWANDAHDTVGVPIGTSALTDIKLNRATSGIVIFDKSAWQQGIATAAHRARCHYAHHVMGLNAIDSGALRGNVGSIGSLCKVGYVHTGVEYGAYLRQGQPIHHELLLWVNPTERNWNYFWGDNGFPKKFIGGRRRAQSALNWANEHVTFL